MKTIINFLTSETFGFLLKLFSGLAAVAFGILGVGSKTREDDGRFTLDGKIALVGIIVAGSLAVGTSVYEFATSLEKAKDDKKRSDELMLSIQSGLYPLRTMNLQVAQELTETNIGGLSEYRTRLMAALASKPCAHNKKLFTCSFPLVNGRPDVYLIKSDSPLYPQKGSEVLTELVEQTLTLSFFGKEPDASQALSFKRIGEAAIETSHIPLQDQWVLYRPKTGTIFYGINGYDVPDSVMTRSGVYSITEVLSGFIAIPIKYLSDVKEQYVSYFEIRFNHPKFILLNGDHDELNNCHLDHVGNFTVIPIRASLTSENNLALPRIPPSTLKAFCAAIEKDPPNF